MKNIFIYHLLNQIIIPKNKTKININYNFIFIKNLTNFLILYYLFFVLINKNSFLYILNRPINHYTTTQCNNSLYNNNLYNNNLSISSLDFKKFKNFLKSKLTTDKKYNHFCSITRSCNFNRSGRSELYKCNANCSRYTSR